MSIRRTRADRQSAISNGIMRHIVGAGRVDARRAAKEAARAPVAPAMPEIAKVAPASPVAAPAAPAEPAKRRWNGKVHSDAIYKAKKNRRVVGRSVDAAIADGSWLTPWEPPKGVLPPGKKVDPTIAMDLLPDGLIAGNVGAMAGWAGDALNVSFAEGIGFLGYSYLAALTQRAEYRRISERFATEMTRKWIRFQTVNKPEEYEAPGPEAKPGEPAGAPGVPADPEQAQASMAEADAAETKERVASSIARKRQLDKGVRIKELEDEMRRLKVKDAFYTIAEGDGWFGRYHLFLDLGTDDRDELATPIGNGVGMVSEMKVGVDTKPARRKPGEARATPRRKLMAVRPIEPMWCYPANYNSLNPMKPDWYNPEEWYVNGITVHRSRLLRFVGREVPDILKPAYAFGGLSMSQMAKPYVDNWLRTRQAVCNLIESFSVSGVYTNMAGTLEEGSDEAFNRMEVFNFLRSNAGAMVLDKDTEEFFNVSTPLGTLDALQAQSQEQMSSVSGIPLVILLGITPKGLNASSEGELRAFYDTVHAFQEQFFRDHLQTVIHFVMLSLWGEVDNEITFEFVPLWSMTDKELAEVRKTEAETDGMLIDKGVITNAEARNRVANDPDSQYHDINPADVPEQPEPQDDGGDDPFGGGDDEGGGGDDSGGKADGGFGASDAFAFDEGVEFNEDDHPRADDGKFTSGGGGGKKPTSSGGMPGIPDFLKAKPKSSGGGKQTLKPTSSQTKREGDQKLKMPQYGLTGTPYEAHQKPAGLPKSTGKPKDAGSVVVFRQSEDSPSIGGPKFKSWKPPASWEGISGAGVEEPELPKLPKGVKLSSGVLIREPDGRVWMVRPTKGFGGYQQTFPKGNVGDGLSTQDSAVKEAFEETGLKVKLTGFAGDAFGDTSMTRFYYAERTGGDPADAGREAEAVVLAPVDQLHDYLNRSRDRKIADHLAGKSEPQVDDQVDDDGAELEEPGSLEQSQVSMSDLKKVGGKLGSNEGGQYEDGEGNKYYVKKPSTKAHVANEKAAARLYQLAGVQTLDYVDVGPDHVATKWEKLDKNNIAKMSDAEKKEATNDFMVHAWLSNWDAAGTGGDNQGVRNGKPVTLDVGGSLRYRAQGGEKGKAFGDKVSEIDTMRDPAKSHDAAKLYGKMSEADLRASAERVASIPDSAIREAAQDDKLADTLIARKKDIASRYDLIAQDGALDDDAMMEAALDAVGANLEEDDDGLALSPEEQTANEEQPDSGGFAFDGEPTEVAPGVFAFDEANFEEGKHPRKSDGKFAPKGAGESSGGEEGQEAEAGEKKPEFKSKKEHIGWLLEKGTTPKELMQEMGWPSVSMPAQAAALGMKLEKKDGKYFGTKMTDAELTEFKAAAAAKKAAKKDTTGKAELADVYAQPGEKPQAAVKPEDVDFGPYTNKPDGELDYTGFKSKMEHYVKYGENDLAIGLMEDYPDHAKQWDKDTIAGAQQKKVEPKPKGIELAGNLLPVPEGAPETYPQFLGAIAHAGQQGDKETVKNLFLYNPSYHKQFMETAKPAVVAALKKQGVLPEMADPGTAKPATAAKPAAAQPAAKPASVPATEAEKTKAKKSVALQMQYVPNASGLQGNPQAQKLVDGFNSKWAGKEGLSGEQLQEKVDDFKKLNADMLPLMNEAQKAQAVKAAAAKAKADEEAKAALAKEMAELQDPEIKKHFEVLKDIGVNKSAWKHAENVIKANKLAITPQQGAYIQAYVGHHYDALNEQLWSDVLDEEQAHYASALDDALDKMPIYEGKVTRGIKSLTEAGLAKYKAAVGKVKVEKGFSSAGVHGKLWGKATMHITSKTARDIRAFNSSEGGGEVVFKKGTQFKILKVEGWNIYAEEFIPKVGK